MTRRTRYFVLSSLLVLAVGLGTGLVAFYVGLPAALGAADGPAELVYVPANASVVAYAEVRDVMTSDVRQRIRRVAPIPEDGQRQFQERTGIDIESDIDRVVASLQPEPDGRTAGLVIASGRFSDVKIEALMRERGASVAEHGGKRVIVHQDAGGGGSMALSFLEPGLVAVGSASMVRAAIDVRKSGDNVTRNVELMRLLDSLEAGNAWALGRLDGMQAGGKLPAEIATRIPALSWFSVSGRFDTDIRGVIRAAARDEQAANDLRDVVRGFLALAKLQAGTRPELQTLMQSLELSGTGNNVALSFTIPGAVFDALPPRQ
jgi:hypothetical protein